MLDRVWLYSIEWLTYSIELYSARSSANLPKLTGVSPQLTRSSVQLLDRVDSYSIEWKPTRSSDAPGNTFGDFCTQNSQFYSFPTPQWVSLRLLRPLINHITWGIISPTQLNDDSTFSMTSIPRHDIQVQWLISNTSCTSRALKQFKNSEFQSNGLLLTYTRHNTLYFMTSCHLLNPFRSFKDTSIVIPMTTHTSPHIGTHAQNSKLKKQCST